MPTAVPVVACITTALIVFVVGSYMYRERSVQPAHLSGDAEPLFSRSVEQGSLRPDRWPQGRLEVPYYGPMVELLTLGASRSAPRQSDDLRQPPPEPAKVTSAREKRREDTRRHRATRAPGNETIDPGDAYARGEPQQRGGRSSSEENERRRSRGLNREQDTRRSWDQVRRGETRREPERTSPKQRWPSERREVRDGFNLFGGFERR